MTRLRSGTMHMNARICACGTRILWCLTLAESADLRERYEWRQVKIGGGGFVTGIVSHPGVPGLYYCRTDVGGGGVWRSTDGGDTWADVSTVAGKGPGAQTLLRDAELANNGRVACCSPGKTWLFDGAAWQEITPNGV